MKKILKRIDFLQKKCDKKELLRVIFMYSNTIEFCGFLIIFFYAMSIVRTYDSLPGKVRLVFQGKKHCVYSLEASGALGPSSRVRTLRVEGVEVPAICTGGLGGRGPGTAFHRRR